MRLYQPTYTKDVLDKRVTKKSSVWWVDYTVNGRSYRRSTGARDKAAASVKAAALVREAELRAAGIETHGDTTRATLACLLGEYRADMARRGLAPKHVATTSARCFAIFGDAVAVAEMTPAAVRLGLERLRGASAKTINGYRTAVHGFFTWLVREGRWPTNPVNAVKPVKVVEAPGDQRRRALTPNEQRRLADALGGARLWAPIYDLAMHTGLRRGELKALTPHHFERLDTGRWQIRLPADATKNRQEAVLPLPSRFNDFVVKEVLWPVVGMVPSMADFRRDLRTASIPEASAEGIVDFHALRVTFGTNLARAGVPLALAQRLLRHSDPALTSTIYTRLRVDDEQAAVDRAVPDYINSTLCARDDARAPAPSPALVLAAALDGLRGGGPAHAPGHD